MELRTTRRPRSVTLALGALALGVWSIAGFVDDARIRESATDFARHFTLDERRPLEIGAMGLEHSADGAAAVAVDAALEDALGEGPPQEVEPRIRALWQRAGREIVPELESSRGLALEALRRRPGRAQHRFLVGRVAYELDARSGKKADPALWLEPLSLAAVAAPGLDPIFVTIGGAYLDSWPRIPAERRSDAPKIWQRAFMDPGFVTRGLLPIAGILGTDTAISLVPDRAGALRAAFDAMTRAGDVPRAAAMRPRLDRALRAEREEGLVRIQRRLEAGDLEGARTECLQWLSRSPAAEFDDAAGRAQTARLLELWPNDTGGSWRTDPRGELVRYFLNRREKAIAGEVLVRATEALTAVPDTVRARVRLLAGDLPGAEEIRAKSPSPTSYDWVPYLVEVARGKLASGDAGGARAILKSLSASAAEGCDVLVLRRDVATALGDAAEEAIVAERLRWLRRDTFPPDAWSASGILSVCLDDRPPRTRGLRVSILADGPAIVAWGWNGGRDSFILVPRGSSTLTLPIPSLFGRQTVSVFREAGASISLGAVTVESSPEVPATVSEEIVTTRSDGQA